MIGAASISTGSPVRGESVNLNKKELKSI